jgi:hypothetical protein
MKFKVVCRKYEYNCGDGCCYESSYQIKFFIDDNCFYLDTLYTPNVPENENELIAFYNRIPQEKFIHSLLNEVIGTENFQFVFTTDQYDND